MSKKGGKKILQLCAIDMTIKNLLLPLIDALTRGGFDVTSCSSYGKHSDELRNRGYKVKNIEIDRKISPISNVKSVLELYRFIKSERFDIVHVHTPVAAILGRIAAKLAGVPLVIYTAHGFYFHERMPKLKYRIFVVIEKIIGRLFTDYIFTQSEEDRLTAIKEAIIDKNRISTIGNGVDVENKFNPSIISNETVNSKKIELGIEENKKVIMFTGRLVKEKGILELLMAFTELERNDCVLLLVGGLENSERDKEAIGFIQQTVNSDNRIIMAGSRSDIEYLLFLSDIFILPSHREGMPRSIIEAMAMCKPVISTNIRGSREEVVDGQTGFLFEINDINTLKQKMTLLLDDQELRETMGNEGRKRAEALFDEEKVIKKQLMIINGLIESKRG